MTTHFPSSDSIRDILAKRIDTQKQATGIAVAVLDSNGPRLVTHGTLAANDPRAVNGDTIFEIGSITKLFTSLLLADMVGRNEVSLNDLAATYLPSEAQLRTPITLLHLATHTSGLPPMPANMKLEGYSFADLYEFLGNYTPPRAPGDKVEYSNLGAGLLGHLLARRAGTDYESLVKERITQALGMSDTTITLSAAMKTRAATGHTSMLAPTVNLDLATLAGAGALRSTANDMLVFLSAVLGYEESPLAPTIGLTLDKRLAWLFSVDIAWHNGGTRGYRSYLGCNLKSRVGVVVLANAFTILGLDDIGRHLLDPSVPLANPEAPIQRTAISIDPNAIDKYTGRYRVNPNLALEITREGDRLFAQGVANAMRLPKFELFAESADTFFVKVTDRQLLFDIGPDGRAVSVLMQQPGRPDQAATRLPDE